MTVLISTWAVCQRLVSSLNFTFKIMALITLPPDVFHVQFQPRLPPPSTRRRAAILCRHGSPRRMNQLSKLTEGRCDALTRSLERWMLLCCCQWWKRSRRRSGALVCRLRVQGTGVGDGMVSICSIDPIDTICAMNAVDTIRAIDTVGAICSCCMRSHHDVQILKSSSPGSRWVR